MGSRERVKFAEENNALAESGGRPCLTLGQSFNPKATGGWQWQYFTRSAKLRECNGWLTRAAISSSATDAVLGM